MKIVLKDNTNRNRAEILVADHVLSTYANIFVDLLNRRYGGPNSPNLFEVEDDDYELHRFEP